MIKEIIFSLCFAVIVFTVIRTIYISIMVRKIFKGIYNYCLININAVTPESIEYMYNTVGYNSLYFSWGYEEFVDKDVYKKIEQYI